jgi:RiboL-PSP-HEPN
MNTSPSLVFRDSLDEVHALLQIHAQLTSEGPGRRHNVEVLNKSAILFACAAFEAFVENLATNAFEHIVNDSKDHSALPKQILRATATLLKDDKNDIKVWELAGTGWKTVVESYRKGIVFKYIGPFNTPKPHNIEALLRELIGMPNLPASWHWGGMSAAAAQEKLKAFVTLRGALAHGEKPPPKVRKQDVNSYLAFLGALSVRSSNQVRHYCHSVTGKYPWGSVIYGTVK